MFISQAWATDAVTAGAATATEAASGGTQGFLVSMFPLLIILLIFYVMVLRPQNKRIAEHRNLISNLRRGDKIVTGGGIIGTVKKVVADDEVQVEIADGVVVRVVSGTIMTLRSKADPATDAQSA